MTQKRSFVDQVIAQTSHPIQKSQKHTFVDQVIAQRGHLIHKLKAKDSTGREAYYFVMINPIRERAFYKAIKCEGTLDLEDFGKVIASCYGVEPDDETKKFLKEKYGFEV